MCCPVERELRKEWLLKLENEHSLLIHSSKEIARKSKIFSNPSRVEILLMLDQREHCMDEISRTIKARKSAVSYHIMLLKDQGLICMKKRSHFVYYSLSEKGKKAIAVFEGI
jgi:ArsR family transcriptional regulator